MSKTALLMDSVGVGLGTGDHTLADRPAANTDVVMAGSQDYSDTTGTDHPCLSEPVDKGVCSEEDIANTWNDFYYCIYWHCFQCYKYGIGSGEEDVGGAMQEEKKAESVSEETLGEESVDKRSEEEDESGSIPVVSVCNVIAGRVVQF
mgnify:CR=1 FL=1